MKIKWIVSEKNSGVYSSFYNRAWPSARYMGADGEEYTAGSITSQSAYKPSEVKTGAHEPLHVHVAVWENPRIPSHAAFKQQKIGVVPSLTEAKKLLQDYITAHPEILPPALCFAQDAPSKKAYRAKP